MQKGNFHIGVNIFRVIVCDRDDDYNKYYPIKGESGSVNELYCLDPDVTIKIWLSLLSDDDTKIDADYTEWKNHEKSAGAYNIKQTFKGEIVRNL